MVIFGVIDQHRPGIIKTDFTCKNEEAEKATQESFRRFKSKSELHQRPVITMLLYKVLRNWSLE